MLAILRPLRDKQEAQVVQLLARTGRDRLRVQLIRGKMQIFAVDRFRLFSRADRRLNVDRHVLDALPWKGAGPDPLAPVAAPEPGNQDGVGVDPLS